MADLSTDDIDALINAGYSDDEITQYVNDSPPAASWMDTVQGGVAATIPSIAESASNGMGWLADTMGRDRSFWDETSQMAEGMKQQQRDNLNLNNMGEWQQRAYGAIPTVMEYTAAAPFASPLALATTMGLETAANKYKKNRDEGYGYEDSTLNAGGAGVVTGATAALPMSFLTKPLSGPIRNILGLGLTNAALSPVMTTGNLINDAAWLGKIPTPEEIKQQYIDDEIGGVVNTIGFGTVGYLGHKITNRSGKPLGRRTSDDIANDIASENSGVGVDVGGGRRLIGHDADGTPMYSRIEAPAERIGLPGTDGAMAYNADGSPIFATDGNSPSFDPFTLRTGSSNGNPPAIIEGSPLPPDANVPMLPSANQGKEPTLALSRAYRGQDPELQDLSQTLTSIKELGAGEPNFQPDIALPATMPKPNPEATILNPFTKKGAIIQSLDPQSRVAVEETLRSKQRGEVIAKVEEQVAKAEVPIVAPDPIPQATPKLTEQFTPEKKVGSETFPKGGVVERKAIEAPEKLVEQTPIVTTEPSVAQPSIRSLPDPSYMRKPIGDMVLSPLPSNTLSQIGTVEKPILLKQNIVEKNLKNHKELGTAENSLDVLSSALYDHNLIIQDKPKDKPNYWVLVKQNGKNKVSVVEISDLKTHHEIIGWGEIGKKQLEQKLNRAKREGGQSLITNRISPEGAAGRSALPSGTNDIIGSTEPQINENKTASSPASSARLPNALKGERGSTRIINDLHDWIKARQQKVEDLSDSQDFLEARSAPAITRSIIAWERKHLSNPRTVMVVKFPKLKPAYEAGVKVLEDISSATHDAYEVGKPLYALKDSSRDNVGRALDADRKAAKKLRDNGKGAPELTDAQLVKHFNLTPEEIKGFRAIRDGYDQGAELIREGLLLRSRKVQGVSFEVVGTRPDGVIETKQEFKTQQEATVFKKQLDDYGLNTQVAKIPNSEIYKRDVNDYVDSIKTLHYSSAMRFGTEFDVVATDPKVLGKDGKPIVIYREFFDSRTEAVKAHQAQVALKRTSVIRRKPKLDMAAFDTLPPDLSSQLSAFDPDKWTNNVKDRPNHGFTKHLIHANLTEGASTDIGRSYLNYQYSLAKWVARERAEVVFDSVKKILDPGLNPNGGDNALAVYLNTYIKDLYTPQSGAITRANDGVNFMLLAGVMSSGAANLTQTFTTTHPEILKRLQHIDGGTPGVSHLKLLPKSELMLIKAMKNSFDFWWNKKALAKKNPELANALHHAVTRGDLEANSVTEFRRVGEGGTIHRSRTRRIFTLETLMKTFTIPEKIDRTIAFCAGHEIAKLEGYRGEVAYGKAISFADDSARKRAVDFVEETQFNQTRANRPEFARHGIGRNTMMYKLYAGNYIRFLRNSLNKQDWPIAAMSLGYMWAIAGLMGIPGVRDVNHLLQGFGTDVTMEIREAFQNAKRLGTGLASGIPAAFGVNMSGSVGQGEYLANVDKDPAAAITKFIAGASGSLVANVFKAVSTAKKTGNTWVAAEQTFPRFLKGPSKLLRVLNDPTHTLRDAYNMPLVENMTYPEMGLMTAGFMPTRLSESYELNRAKQNLQDSMTHEGVTTRIATARFNGDVEAENAIMDAIDAHNDTAPDGREIRPDENAINLAILGMEDKEAYDLKKTKKSGRGAMEDLQDLFRR